MQAYFYFIKMKILSKLSYRYDVFISSIGTIIVLLTSIFIWKVSYSGTGVVNGVSLRQMITYTIISTYLSILFEVSVYRKINDNIVSGNIEVDYFRPIDFMARYFSEDVGNIVCSFFIKVVPLFVFCVIFIDIPYPKDSISAVLFVFSSFLSFIILWLINGVLALLAFWTMELGHLINVVGALINIFSGSFVPLWFFPKTIQVISKFLPFQYIYQTPLSVYIGKITPNMCLKSMLIQVVWITILFILLINIKSKVKKHLLIQGA